MGEKLAEGGSVGGIQHNVIAKQGVVSVLLLGY